MESNLFQGELQQSLEEKFQSNVESNISNKGKDFNPFQINPPIKQDIEIPESKMLFDLPEEYKNKIKEKMEQKFENICAGRDRKDSVFAIEKSKIKNPLHYKSNKDDVTIVKDKRPSFFTNTTNIEQSKIQQISKNSNSLNHNSENITKCYTQNSNLSSNCSCNIF